MAARHAAEYPHAWTDELAAATTAWNLTRHHLKALEPKALQTACAHAADLNAALTHLADNAELHKMLACCAMRAAANRLASAAVPTFWAAYSSLDPKPAAAGDDGAAPLSVDAERRCADTFVDAMSAYHGAVAEELDALAFVCERRWEATASAGAILAPARSELLLLAQTAILAGAPSFQAFEAWAAACWSRLLGDAMRGVAAAADEDGDAASDDEDEMDDDEDGAPGQSSESDASQLLILSRLLESLGWLPLVESSLSSTLHARLRGALHKRCEGRFDVPCLDRELSIVERHIRPRLSVVLGGSAPQLDLWLARLSYIVRQSVSTLRISELFDIVVDYPDSRPALDDLAECLRHTQQHVELISELCHATGVRLLQPGATTTSIIQVYICMIRALQRLDPSGLTLEAVSEPVRAYLKARSDTVRQIVTSLTDPESSDWLDPLDDGDASAGAAAAAAEATGGAAGADLPLPDGEVGPWWEPAPMQVDGGWQLSDGRGGEEAADGSSPDVLAILVNIYGSKALFVNEFRSMLADKLLTSVPGSDTERDVRNVELLKKRFGDVAMQACEVMLTDVAESRRLSRTISRHFSNAPVGGCEFSMIDATVVSRLCWPQLPVETFELPPQVTAEMARYEKQYMHLRAPRKLVWRPTLGCVTLDVQFADRTLENVSCTPLQATILLKFADQPHWALGELATALRVDATTLRRRLAFWLNRGIVRKAAASAAEESGGGEVYVAASSLGAADSSSHAAEDDDGPDASATLREEQLAAEMRVYEQYVMGMLTNLESLPLQRIHNMLKMFVPDTGGEGGYDRSEQELQRFLNHLVEVGTLEHSAGQYRVKRE